MLTKCLLLLTLAALAGPALPIQPSTGMVLGVVEDSEGRGLPDVQVLFVGVRSPVMTDSLGRFRVGPLKPASYVVQFRRLGFEGVTHVAQVVAADTLRLAVEMQGNVDQLAAVKITGESMSERLTRVGFVHRRSDGAVPSSRFITRAEFAARPPLNMNELLRRMGGFDTRCVQPTVYVDGTLFAAPVAAQTVPNKVPKRKDMFFSEGFTPPSPLDGIPPLVVDAVEVYTGPSEVPLEFKAAGRGFSCVVLVWTRS